MSFGFSVGDFVALGRLSWTVYQACREAPSTFGQLSQEVLSMNAVLREIEEVCRDDDLKPSRQEGLKLIMTGCRGVLEDLQTLLKKHETLGTKANRAMDRIGWATVDIDSWRQRLTTNVTLLFAYLRCATRLLSMTPANK